jgi:hypothetical protein
MTTSDRLLALATIKHVQPHYSIPPQATLESAKGSTVHPYQRSIAVKMETNERKVTWQSLK